MNLQTIFYSMGIVFMSLFTLMLLMVVILLFYIKAKVTQVTNMIENRLEQVKEVVEHPGDMAASVGAAVATGAFNKVSEMIKSKKEKNR